jgi:hypothetical protein
VQQGQGVEPQALARLVERAAHAVGVEDPGDRVGVHLREHDLVRGQPAQPGDRAAEQPLALTVGVVVRGVELAERTGQHRIRKQLAALGALAERGGSDGDLLEGRGETLAAALGCAVHGSSLGRHHDGRGNNDATLRN